MPKQACCSLSLTIVNTFLLVLYLELKVSGLFNKANCSFYWGIVSCSVTVIHNLLFCVFRAEQEKSVKEETKTGW